MNRLTALTLLVPLVLLTSPSVAQTTWMRWYAGKETITRGISGIHFGIAGGGWRGSGYTGGYIDASLMGKSPRDEVTYDFSEVAFSDPILDREVEGITHVSAGYSLYVPKTRFSLSVGGGVRYRQTYTKLRDDTEILSSDGIYYTKNDDLTRQGTFDLGVGLAFHKRWAVQVRASWFKAGTSTAISLARQSFW